MIIAVDAMGGDNAPRESVLGAVQALQENKDINIVLVGNEERITQILNTDPDIKEYDKQRLTVRNASEVIENEDSPVRSLRSKKDSSMVVGFNMIKDKEADVLVSAGNTGALVAGGSLLVGRIEGVDRPALSAIIPTAKGYCLLADAGANANCRPLNYLQFAVMGWHYMSAVSDNKNPTVKLLNIGAEDHKGTETVKNAYRLLQEYGPNFCGNLEGREMVYGDADVVISDGFSGNIAIKVLEGTGMYMSEQFKNILMSGIISKMMALSVSKEIRAFKKKMDYSEYGGAPLLGIKGKVIKCHGASKAKAFKNAILLSAVRYAESDIIEKLSEEIKTLQDVEFDG